MTYQEYMNLLQTKVIDILNKGINPWQPADRARNGVTDRRYSGANAVMLYCSSLMLHDGDMRWYTFNQAKQLGCSVRKGEKATPAYFFQNTVERAKKDEDGNIVKDANGLTVYETVRIPPIFKVYYVFNARQLDPIPRQKEMKYDDSYDREMAETILSNTPVRINYDEKNKVNLLFLVDTENQGYNTFRRERCQRDIQGNSVRWLQSLSVSRKKGPSRPQMNSASHSRQWRTGSQLITRIPTASMMTTSRPSSSWKQQGKR